MLCCPGGPASPCSHPPHRPQAPPDARQTGIGPFVSLPHELASQTVRPFRFPSQAPPPPHHLSNKPFPQKLKLKSRACSLPHHPESCSAPCRGVNASLHVDDHFSTHTQGPRQPSSLCQCSLLRQLEERCPIGNCTPSLKHPVPPHRQASGSVWGQELATALGALLQLPCCPVPDNNPGPTTAQSCGQRLAASSCPAGAVSPEQG